ncbi:MAG: DUF362 domain-containing protein [Terracidiphilus sp.]
MKSRREFLKKAATGALVLASRSKPGLASILDREVTPGVSKVVVAKDPQLHRPNAQLDEKRVIELLDTAMTAYTGRVHPVDAWKRIVPVGKVIGLKVNTVGLKPIATHLSLVLAICERLQQSGVKAGNILVWERTAEELEAGGFTINTDRSRIRCYGSDVAGFEDQVESWGVVRVRLSKILTRECGMVLNLPVLKDHANSGVTFAMKNMYGAIKMEDLKSMHSDFCNPAIADLNCIPEIRDKVRMTIGDAISAQYEGGPLFHPEHLWHPNALIVGEDRVAVDHTAWTMIERKRADLGLPTLAAAGRAPAYIATAADADHRLGTNDPQRFQLVEA